MFEERMILYASHELPDSYRAGHIVLKIHPDYIFRFSHSVNRERLGKIVQIGNNRYKFVVSEFHSFQGVLAWITNLEMNPESIPEPYYPPEPHINYQPDTTNAVFWAIIIGTVLIILIGSWLF